MEDHIVRATAAGVRAFAAVSTKLVDEAKQRHDCYPVSASALGRTMTGALLLAANLKTSEDLTIRIVGDGPLGEIVADASAHGTVRGYVRNPHVDLPLNNIGKLDVGKAVGTGQLYVTRFTGLKQPFTGSTPLVSGEIAEDITNYLLKSEQTPSTVSLGVLINPDLSVAAAGGFLVQALPGAQEDVLARIEDNIAEMASISVLISQGLDASQIIDKIFKKLPAMIYEPEGIAFACRCSRERVANMLISLGAVEVEGMIADNHKEVVCHFCNEKYTFTDSELTEIADIAKSKAHS